VSVATERIKSFTRLSVPVPPTLDRACGYRGRARYIGLYWDQTEGKFAWYDGRARVVGTVFSAWLTYIQHPLVEPAVRDFELGSDNPATHMFLLDRVKQTARVGRIVDVESYLQDQWKAAGVEIEPPHYLRSEKLFDPTNEIPHTSTREEFDAFESLISWLNARPAATPFWLKIIHGGR
jgi:hypothetical protein